MTKLEELTKYIKKLPADTVNTLLDSVKNLLVSNNTVKSLTVLTAPAQKRSVMDTNAINSASYAKSAGILL